MQIQFSTHQYEVTSISLDLIKNCVNLSRGSLIKMNLIVRSLGTKPSHELQVHCATILPSLDY